MSCSALTNSERARIQFVIDYFAQNYEKPVDQLAADALKGLHNRFGYSSEIKLLTALRDSPHTAILQGLRTVLSDDDALRVQFVINYFAQNYEKPIDQFAADALKELSTTFGFGSQIKFLEGLRDAPHTTLLQAMLNVSCSGNNPPPPPPSFPTPIEYWKFDESGGNRVGQIQGLLLVPQFGQAVPGVVGKINNAAKLTNKSFPNPTLSTDSPFYRPELKNLGTGFSICGWANITDGNQTIVFLGFYDSSDNTLGYVFIDASAGSFQTTVSGSDYNNVSFTVHQTDSPPPPGTWFFYRVWYDILSSRIKIQVNNGTIAQSAATLSFSSSPKGYISISSDSFAGAGSFMLVDEMGLWMPALTDDQATFLYNSGAGRTYPF